MSFAIRLDQGQDEPGEAKMTTTADEGDRAGTGGGTGPSRRRAGRPAQGILSRRLIFETALRLVDRGGAEAAGIRAVAKELGVQPSALYNHVDGYPDLVAGMRELISDRIPLDMFDRSPWDEALVEWSGHYRDTFAAHPSTVALLAVLPLAEESSTTLMYDGVIRALVRAGWPEERVLVLLVALESFILGSALDLGADEQMLDPGPREDVPVFTSVYRARAAMLAAKRQSTADASFEFGLRAMLTGFRAEFESLRGDGA
ncbi:helix-turn-helix domain-containing protein [Leucobacter iarius]|uniref:Helix-turn-helix domain-containing protein n=2 Tax=Leucobacter iarius TaxID=333963 RepID=A0ABN2LQ57_9MICO